MADDQDLMVIKALFGAGVVLMLTALLVFGDGESGLVLVALAAGLALAVGYGVTRWRKRGGRARARGSHGCRAEEAHDA